MPSPLRSPTALPLLRPGNTPQEGTPTTVLPALGRPVGGRSGLVLPATLVLYAFDLPTPQMRDFLGALEGAGTEVLTCVPEGRRGAAVRVPFATPAEEIAEAARWARAYA